MSGNYRFGKEKVVAVKVVVHAAGDLGGFGTECGASAFKKDDDYNAAEIGVGVAGEPSKASSSTRAGSGLT